MTNGNCLLIVGREIRRYERLNANGERLLIRFVNPDMRDIEVWMRRCIEGLLIVVEEDLNIQPADRVGINFANSEDAQLNFAFTFRRFDQYSATVILDGLEKVLQSNARFLEEDCLIVEVDHAKVPVGYGR